MTYDPAWDMPKVNWQQQGSFEIPEIPPIYEPDAEPLVCLPAINRYWLPYVMGALDQLRNPSSWIVADDTAMYDTLARVSKLKEMIGVGVPCMSFAIRFDALTCQLQQSTDGGSTWIEVDGWSDFASCLPPQTQVRLTDTCLLEESFDGGSTWPEVDGWAANFGSCVQGAIPVIGLPPNPNDKAPDVLACAIAAYLAQDILLSGIQQAVNNINNNLLLLDFGASVLTLIPEFVLVAAFYDAVASIYTVVSEGNLSNFEAALADPTLLPLVTCAIYNAIVGDGYVDPANCGAIIANISGISYTYPDVISAIAAYASAIGCTGLAQVSQIAGLAEGGGCGGCAAPGTQWGFLYDTTGTKGDFNAWTLTLGTTVGANGLESHQSGGDQFLRATAAYSTAHVDGWQVRVTRVYDSYAATSLIAYVHGGTSFSLTGGSGPGTHTLEQDILTTSEELVIAFDTSQHGQSGDTYVDWVWLWGTGTCPFGTPNYHYPP